MRRVIPDLELVRRILDYNPDTGIFTWKESGGSRKGGSRRREGNQTGSLCGNGYRYIGIEKERYIAAHLAWYITYGEWPDKVVDHIDGDKTNDAIANLRLVDKRGNAENSKSKQRENYGVYRHRDGRYKVQLYIKQRNTHFGLFNTVEEAREEVKRLRLKYGI